METISNRIEKHYYAYKSINVDPPEFRITPQEKYELLNHLLTIFSFEVIDIEKQNEFMGVKLKLVMEIE